MRTIGVNSIEVIITIGLIYAVIKFWNWKLIGGYNIQSENKSFGVFQIGQIIMVPAMMIVGFDPQNQIYMEQMSFFGKGSLDLWTLIGLQVFTLCILFIFTNIIGILLYKVANQSENGLFEDIKNDKLSSVIIAATIIFAIGYSSSVFILKPLLLDWLGNKAGIIPLN